MLLRESRFVTIENCSVLLINLNLTFENQKSFPEKEKHFLDSMKSSINFFQAENQISEEYRCICSRCSYHSNSLLKTRMQLESFSLNILKPLKEIELDFRCSFTWRKSISDRITSIVQRPWFAHVEPFVLLFVALIMVDEFYNCSNLKGKFFNRSIWGSIISNFSICFLFNFCSWVNVTFMLIENSGGLI